MYFILGTFIWNIFRTTYHLPNLKEKLIELDKYLKERSKKMVNKKIIDMK